MHVCFFSAGSSNYYSSCYWLAIVSAASVTVSVSAAASNELKLGRMF